jgi:lipoprotein-anchoring transpeptidase ErfK/SrfK
MATSWIGVGFHDATWQPVFGGTWYLAHGSHGCINMPYAKARELYATLPLDCPVLLHY